MIIALEEAKYKLIGMRDDIKDLGSALRIEQLKATAEELEMENEELRKQIPGLGGIL